MDNKEKTALAVRLIGNGTPCRDRTCDPLIKSQLLYHLS